LPRIVVIGSINMDLVVRAERLPKPGETVRGREFQTIPGGKGANQAVAAARLGAETHMVGRVGYDEFGRRLRQSLADNGVHVEYVTSDREHPNGVAVILVQESGENSIVVAAGANAAVSMDDLKATASVIQAADAVLLQLEIPLETVATALQMAGAAKVRSILDAGPAADVPEDLKRAADVISPNMVEAEALLGHAVSSALDAARELVGRGAPACVVKAGAQGCAWVSPQGAEHIAAIAVKAVDTTAAGDAFTAALAVALAEGKSLPEAARWANFAGALAVTRFGAQPSMPPRRELEQFISSRTGGS
jgi:ribokinase